MAVQLDLSGRRRRRAPTLKTYFVSFCIFFFLATFPHPIIVIHSHPHLIGHVFILFYGLIHSSLYGSACICSQWYVVVVVVDGECSVIWRV